MFRRIRRVVARGAVVGVVYVGVVSYTPEAMLPPALLPARNVNESLWRMMRSTAVVAHVIGDYAVAPYFFSTDEKESLRQWSELHRRNAKRCVQLAEKNGGLYIKAGQGIAAMNNVLPKEYCEEMRPLHDSVAKRPFDVVERVICRAFGVACADDVFTELDRTAIAAASIAQVHTAIYKGKKVAVKVQYEDVARLFGGDMLTLLGLFRIIRWLMPKIDFVKMLEEVEEYMKTEFDFESEGRYSDMFRCAMEERFPDGSVVVPRVVWDATRPQVLVTEFFDGALRSDDVAGMANIGVDSSAAARLVVDGLGYALFTKGICHADPHPGNILVRNRNGKPQVAILDFGLTVVLPDSFRKALCELYVACALHDTAALARLGPIFGVAHDATERELSVFASCTMQEPYDIFSVAAGVSYSHNVDRAREYWDKEGEYISKIFERCPREFTMAITNLDMTRALHQDMRAAFNRVIATLSIAESAVLKTMDVSGGTPHGGLLLRTCNRVLYTFAKYRRLIESQLFVWVMKFMSKDNGTNLTASS